MSLVVHFTEIFNGVGLLGQASHWQRIELGKIVKIQNGYPLKSSAFSSEQGFPIIRIRDLKFNAIQTYYKEEFPSAFIVDNGDLLIGMDGDFICYQWNGGKAVLNQRVCKLITDDSLLVKKFLFYGINGYLGAIQNATSSVTVKHLSSIDIGKIPFPVPPLSEQHRIVSKLDALFEKVEINKKRLEKIPQILKRFRQSLLADAVSGKLTEDWRNEKEYEIETDLPLEWRFAKIDKLVNSTKKDLRTGPFGTTLKKSEHQLFGIPVWGIESIGENGTFTGFNKIFVSIEKAKELKSFEVNGGNIIISRSGTVGEICILPDDVQYGLISTNLMKIVLNNDVILSKYFCWLFDGSQIVIDKLRELCTGSTRLFLTQTILKEIDYPLPPIEEQKEIVRRVDQLLAFVDKIEVRYIKAKAMLDKLPQSILVKAFRGELVPQDPDDEPANLLLERILIAKRIKK